jgi:protein transport protein SEC61 subunit alpha
VVAVLFGFACKKPPRVFITSNFFFFFSLFIFFSLPPPLSLPLLPFSSRPFSVSLFLSIFSFCLSASYTMSGQLRLLDLVKPFLPILPEVELPLKKVPFDEKVTWTFVTALAFFVMSELPLYGILSSDSSDPLYWLRTILASSRGTLMELGTTPIITAGLIFQLLGGSRALTVNFDLKSDRELFQSAQKLLAILLTTAQAIAVVFSGLYGAPSELGAGSVILLILQLVGAGVFVILMDEILDKGYGFGAGISFFTTINVCQQVFWRAFSFSSNDFGRGTEYTGAVVAFFHYLYTRKSWKQAIVEAFFRNHLPNLLQVYSTVFIFALAVYLLSFRVDIPVKSTKARGAVSSYPIRLFYTGSMPIYLLTSFTANVSLLSQTLFKQFPTNLLVRLFGTWESRPGLSQSFAVSGLAYYIQPPFNLVEALWDPIKTIVYLTVIVFACSAFAKTWAEISGSSPRDVAKLFKQQDIVILGHRDVSVVKELRRIIPVAASVGGAVIGLIVVFSDILGSLGSGTAILVAVTTIQSYYEILAQEGGAGAMSQVLRT